MEYYAYLKNSKIDKQRFPKHIVGKESSHCAIYICIEYAYMHIIVYNAWSKIRRTYMIPLD